ncbi:helix-turn-helix domain-containing protein [Salegentibacter sp. HM20]
MPANILTTDDLHEFKLELFKEMEVLFKKQKKGGLEKYLKSSDVMDRLQISPGTLQNLRINGSLPYVKVGGLIFYDSQDIEKLLEQHKVHNTLNH